MSEKMKRKLVGFYNRNKVLGYFFIVIAAFIIVVRKRRAHRKSIYGVRQRKIAIIMIGIIAVTSIFPSSSMVILNDERVIIRTKLEKPSKIKGLALI